MLNLLENRLHTVEGESSTLMTKMVTVFTRELLRAGMQGSIILGTAKVGK